MEVKNDKMKKLFKDRKLTRKRILEFLDKKGFYVVLILCIAIVGATAVFVTTRNVTSLNEELDTEQIINDEFSEDTEKNNMEADAEVPDGQEIAIGTSLATTKEESEQNEDSKKDNNDNTEKAVAKTDEPKEDKNKDDTEKSQPKDQQKSQPKTDKPTSTEVTKANDKSPNEKKTENKKDKSASKEVKFAMPVIGDITFDYAMDRLVYSKTLEDWRTHSGIDLAADRGTNIKAAADGFVSEIKNDPRFGITIVIDHGNGFKTVYSNLASDDVVSPNQKVKQGDIIGAVGNTALFESAEPPHLHFEVWKDNKPVDPKQYLPLK